MLLLKNIVLIDNEKLNKEIEELALTANFVIK